MFLRGAVRTCQDDSRLPQSCVDAPTFPTPTPPAPLPANRESSCLILSPRVPSPALRIPCHTSTTRISCNPSLLRVWNSITISEPSHRQTNFTCTFPLYDCEQLTAARVLPSMKVTFKVRLVLVLRGPPSSRPACEADIRRLPNRTSNSKSSSSTASPPIWYAISPLRTEPLGPAYTSRWLTIARRTSAVTSVLTCGPGWLCQRQDLRREGMGPPAAEADPRRYDNIKLCPGTTCFASHPLTPRQARF